jgi:hypothetical protein
MTQDFAPAIWGGLGSAITGYAAAHQAKLEQKAQRDFLDFYKEQLAKQDERYKTLGPYERDMLEMQAANLLGPGKLQEWLNGKLQGNHAAMVGASQQAAPAPAQNTPLAQYLNTTGGAGGQYTGGGFVPGAEPNLAVDNSQLAPTQRGGHFGRM